MWRRRGTREKLPRDKLLPKVTVAFFDRPLLTGFLWLTLVVFGLLSYTTLLKREGFPSVNIPIAIVSGTYYVNDSAKVDSTVAKPLADVALQDPSVKSVQTSSASNFFTAQIQYKEGVNAQAAADSLKKTVEDKKALPQTAFLQYNVPYFGATGGDIEKIDVAISFFDQSNQSDTAALTKKAQAAAAFLNNKKIPHVKNVFVKNPFQQVTDPVSGQSVTVQQNFDRYGSHESGQTEFYGSVLIGVTATDGADVIKLDKDVRDAVDELAKQSDFKGFEGQVSASFAPSIKDNLSELQRVLLEGLIAVLIIGSIVIAVRASLITVVSMVTVLLITLGLLFLIGYTLNVITLFALILGLALIVDDTIIMVESIDTARAHLKDRREVILEATKKISRAMVAATLTACLCFAPLLFVGGILGDFIKAIPVTIISALLISLFVALIFIPFFSRFVLLGKKQLGKQAVKEVAAGFEAKLAAFIAKPMLWARGSRRKRIVVITTAIIIGFSFFMAGMIIAKDVVFNIFPPTKDTNGIALNLSFPPGTEIDKAEDIAKQADDLTAEVLGTNFVQASYYNSGSAQGGSLQVEIIPYSKRAVTSPDLVKQLQERFDKDFSAAKASVAQVDLGPPSAAFTVQIAADNRDAAFKAADDMADYLGTVELKRPSGKVAHMRNVNVSSRDQHIRTDNKPIVTVSADFDGNDTTTLVTLAQDAVKQEFDAEKLATYNLPADAVSFNIGQESENQDSFKTLALAFPILLIVIFVLLAFQFRSLLQPLLIFMAIPFSIFGVMLGLRITNNAISFFAMLGFFALVGLSIKNTILLTDYANQARRQGADPIDAAVEALEARFRPLFATSMTAVVSLIPLALASPFWEGLAVVLIFGLLSSTFLVITVFPYYYLGAEYTRLKVSAKSFFTWYIPTQIIFIVALKMFGPLIALAVFPASILLISLRSFYAKRLAH